MLLHHGVLCAGKPGLFQQYAVGNANFPDIVEKCAAVERVEVGVVELHFPPERQGVMSEAFAMSFGVGVARLNDSTEGKEALFGSRVLPLR
jgi:hypothetical protein